MIFGARVARMMDPAVSIAQAQRAARPAV